AFGDGECNSIVSTLLIAGPLAASFGVCQYFDWLHVNIWLTPDYAPEHHLTVLRQSGRVVGTIGNPNYFGVFSVILVLAALLNYWLRPRVSGVRCRVSERLRLRDRLGPQSSSGCLIVGALASLGIVFSGSRTALLALAAGLAALAVLGLFRRQTFSLFRLLSGSGVLILLLIFATGVALLFPRGLGSGYLERLTEGLSIQSDASFGLRLARWRSFVGAFRPHTLGGTADSHGVTTPTHLTGVAPAPAEVQARDAQRKADLLTLTQAIDAFHNHSGRWPAPSDLESALVPVYLAALPHDPATGQPYPYLSTVTGYSLMARLEDHADPDYPVYGIGSSPNYLLNGDLEGSGKQPESWDAIPGSVFSLQHGGSLYSDAAVLFRGNPSDPGRRAGIYQQRFFGRPGGAPFTATVWLKLPRAEPGRLDLYANVIYADGDRADPLTRIAADMSQIGAWQKVSLGILPLAGKQVAYLGIYVVSEGFAGEALIDGFQLVDGTVPLSFPLTREAPASATTGFNPEVNLRRSPLIGVGPQKAQTETAIDDEYLLYAARYGLLGILIYLCLYLGTLILSVRAFLWASAPSMRILAALTAATLVAFLVFNLTAGSFYELQLMAIFWLLAGAAGGTSRAGDRP
ncbi:MAG: O-antigen ligase family protein, partial [Dehalococcoidia bacterium]